MAIQNTTLTGTAADLLPTTGTRAITAIYFQNNSPTVAIMVDIFVVPASGVATTTTRIYKDVSIAVSDTLIVGTSEKIILENGDKLQALASTDNFIHATCSYTTF